ncbi:MAG: terminase large subunit domain-containing protein [Flavobacterium sp.]
MIIRQKLLIHQYNFCLSETKHTVLVCGFGAGKTHGAVVKSVGKLLTSPKNLNTAYYLPNYPLIADIAVPRISEYLEGLGLDFKYNGAEKCFNTAYGKLLLRNMQKPETIVGYETFYSVIDEIDTLPKKKAKAIFNKIIARNRQIHPLGVKNSIDMVSTPEGFNFLYEFTKEDKDSIFLIRAKTSDNPHLPDDYIQTLESQYTKEELTAYLNGEFVNLTSGTVYKFYNRELCGSNATPDHNEPLFIGMDFNIQNTNAVIHVIREGKLIAVDEFAGIYDTTEIANLIREKYPKNEIEINPDASCKNRRSAGLSDYDILCEDIYNFTVNIRRKNPEILHRVRAMNKTFEDGRYLVNSEACPVYSDNLYRQAYKNGLPEKGGGVDDILDAAGYCVVEQFFYSENV